MKIVQIEIPITSISVNQLTSKHIIVGYVVKDPVILLKRHDNLYQFKSLNGSERLFNLYKTRVSAVESAITTVTSNVDGKAEFEAFINWEDALSWFKDNINKYSY